MTTPQSLQADIVHLKNRGYSSRFIAEAFLGSKSRKSTVNDIVARYVKENGNAYDKQEIEQRKASCMEDLGYSKRYYKKKIYKDEVEKEYYEGFAYRGNKLPDHEDILEPITEDWYDKLVDKYGAKEHQNQRVLLVSDLHVPYHHQDALEFLQYLKEKYKPTRVICLGDECSLEANSYHEKDPNMVAAGCELKISLPVIAQLHKMFPKMDIMDSNHGSLVFRKAKTHGIPKEYLKSYNEVLQVDAGWKWHNDLTIDLPNGQQCYICHGKSTDVLKLSKNMGQSAVQGHYHSSLGASYWANTRGLYWGLQTGCLIDHHALAFKYNSLQLNRPLLGSGLIIDSLPVVEPMVLDNEGRWVGRSK